MQFGDLKIAQQTVSNFQGSKKVRKSNFDLSQFDSINLEPVSKNLKN